ncbi:MAG TPA: sigma-70 family RNA polymerase sigma factor [Rhizomicrobium sp.]|nr:sigma-70 family RNA polymerase sigma factor [Rhizomicrobium sp.]
MITAAQKKSQEILAFQPWEGLNIRTIRAGGAKAEMTDYPKDKGFWKRTLKNIARQARGDIDPEELLNIAFLRLERYSAVRPVNDPKAFLVQTAKNLLIDNYRHAQISARYAEDVLQSSEDRDDSPLQDEVFAARARLERVKRGLDQLPPRTREIFLMYRLDELKCSEIAREIGISVSAVEKHIAKAMFFLTKWSEGW